MTAGTVDGDTGDSIYPKQSERTNEDRTSSPAGSSKQEEVSRMPPLPTNSWMNFQRTIAFPTI